MSIDDLLEQHRQDLDKLNNQRRIWLWASSVVFCGIIFLIFGWDWLSGLESKSVWWVIVSLMLIISINWWYWTMRVVRIILYYQEIEYELIKQLYTDVSVVRHDMQDSFKEIISGLKASSR